MPSLPKPLRTKLETAVKLARSTAEAGARAALSALGVAEAEPFGHLTPEQRGLRVRLRAHARQLGDALEGKVQNIRRLEHEVAYEHWHRMLFARFLAENGLLVEPSEEAAVSLEELEYYAEQAGRSLWEHAGYCAHRMLPAVFRPEDPALALELPQEHQGKLERLVAELDQATFLATDSLGWTYQFWQADQKETVNKSGNKIGADELSAVTQLFTEDYMVDFLLDNTLGAWWAGKTSTASDPKSGASTEAEARSAVALPGFPWTYLRFIQPQTSDQSTPSGSETRWVPAAGTFDGWPKTARELRVLDPCMGSGHFIVALFLRLVALRMVEEGLEEAAAQDAVILDNLFGLELDPRCTQIAAFNLALAAWRSTGYRPLPPMHLACSGIAPNTTKDDWLALAARLNEDSPLAGARDLLGPLGQPMLFDARLASGMAQLYDLFQKAPELGSLIDPRRALDASADLFQASFSDLAALLDRALQREAASDRHAEMALAARGLAKAAEILGGRFQLVATNVPYLLARKQGDTLKTWCETHHINAKADLATAFMERCLTFCAPGGSTALVAPQSWLFLGSYRKLRECLLKEFTWNMIARLGPRAFDTIGGEVVNVALSSLTRRKPDFNNHLPALDVSQEKTAADKDIGIRDKELAFLSQKGQLGNPDARIRIGEEDDNPLLETLALALNGMHGGDAQRFRFCFWEVADTTIWTPFQGTCDSTSHYSGREHFFYWPDEGKIHRENPQAFIKGFAAWNQKGVVVNMMGSFPASLYTGEKFDISCTPVVPKDASQVLAIWCFVISDEFRLAVREIDQSIKVTNATFAKVPFDLAHWQKVAAEKYPDGLPKPHSDDPTQWLFNGHPMGAGRPLHVAAARLVGYRWPRQTGSSFPDCPVLEADGLEHLTDDDGIVPLTPLQGEDSAADRLRSLLAAAFGAEWSPDLEAGLLAGEGYAGWSLTDWLRDKFFEDHCTLFHQRPFVWHLWDGHPKGFACLLNYHQLAAPDGGGRRTLEKLTYTYLGDWITRQRAAKAANESGADDRLLAAEELKKRLEAILNGEPPYDLFIRWKSLSQQPLGWDPDINDGVRLNLRPFLASDLPTGKKGAGILRSRPKVKWDKDRGKEPQRDKADYPWFWTWDEKTQDFPGGKDFDGNRWNDLHYTRATKEEARRKQSEAEAAAATGTDKKKERKND